MAAATGLHSFDWQAAVLAHTHRTSARDDEQERGSRLLLPHEGSSLAPSTTWGLGDYGCMAQRLDRAARLAVARAPVTRDDRVLDVGCGTGNAALMAATLGAQVTGVDFEPALLAQARERGEAAGLAVTWQVGDAAALPFADAAFSVVLSLFGVMYAPDHALAAAELARVAAPGARVALAAWVPGSFMPAMGGILAPYLPPPPPGKAPARWGDESALRALLEPVDVSIDHVSGETLPIEFPDREAAVDFLVRTAGHVVAERERLTQQGRWQSLLTDLGALVEQRDEGAGPAVAINWTTRSLLGASRSTRPLAVAPGVARA